MISARLCSVFVAALACAALSPAQDLKSTFARMDRLAKGFRSATADVHKKAYTAVINETDESSGRLTVFRPKLKDLQMLFEIQKPDPGAVAYTKDNKLLIYYPKIDEVQEYDLGGKQSRLVEEFLLLGFGTSSAELSKKYSIRYEQMTTVGSQKADLIELIPKSTEAREQFPRIEMWIAQDGGYPLRLKLHQPSKDYQLAEYTNVQVNPPSVTEASVHMKLPKGVKKVRPEHELGSAGK